MEVTINYNGQAVAVEVTLEVYEFLDRADHKTENLFHEQRRHWDGREFDEYIITTESVGAYGETPEEYLCRKETLHELMAVLDTCTEAQRRRFLLYRQIAADNKLLKEIKARMTRLYRWSKAEAEKPQTQQSSLTALWEAQQQLNAPRTRTGKIRALQESAALFSFLQANGIQSMQQLHEKIADMNSRYYDLRGKIVKAERRITTLTERGEMWEQYNQYKSIHKQLAKVKPEKREQFEQRHSRELILYDAAARYLKELKDSGEAITPKAWQLEIDQLAAGKQTDTLAMKSMREDLKAVERLRKTAEQLSRQERDKPHDREPER